FVTLDCGEDKPDDTWVYYGLNDFTALRREQAAFLRDELKSKAHRQAFRRVLIHHIPLWGNTDAPLHGDVDSAAEAFGFCRGHIGAHS
ncbi:MAG: hypothetical protein K2F82_05650, partial [Muribaculaceae bacterium]|nr:hypothetical protein [Muribaculaceae bacterium]